MDFSLLIYMTLFSSIPYLIIALLPNSRYPYKTVLYVLWAYEQYKFMFLGVHIIMDSLTHDMPNMGSWDFPPDLQDP